MPFILLLIGIQIAVAFLAVALNLALVTIATFLRVAIHRVGRWIVLLLGAYFVGPYLAEYGAVAWYDWASENATPALRVKILAITLIIVGVLWIIREIANSPSFWKVQALASDIGSTIRDLLDQNKAPAAQPYTRYALPTDEELAAMTPLALPDYQEEIDAVVTKVKKLLALASNNPNSNEAALAGVKAKELIETYNLKLEEARTERKNE
jgi:hypothetical protein